MTSPAARAQRVDDLLELLEEIEQALAELRDLAQEMKDSPDA